jgi:hypothetical protein
MAVPSLLWTKLAAARIVCSSSPSAKTTRFGARRTRWKMRWRVPTIGSRRAESWTL